MNPGHSKRFLETSRAYASAPLEMFDVLRNDGKKYRASASAYVSNENMTEVIKYAESTLPFAAEEYQISSNIEDYVIVPVTIMPTELPNTNGVGFPLKELTRFNTTTGTLAYQTWKGKPMFVEHRSEELTASKGIVLDSRMIPYKRNPFYWKVVTLSAIDRNKDPTLAADILSGVKNSYSMGAYLDDYICSICGSRVTQGGCEHALLKNPKFNIYSVGGIDRLAYLIADNPLGAEVSSVEVPAYFSALENDVLAGPYVRGV